jgi:ADP-L-glycero-D-manno-heptose 6-epimerase
MDSKIFIVSGGTGFIGSNIVKYIYENTNSKIIVFDRTLKKHNMIEDDRINYIESLLENKETYEMISQYDFNCFFHCAAIVDTLFNNKEIITKINSNSMHYIIELCMKKKATLVYSSSASVYGNTNKNNKINDELYPETMYAKSKLDMENIAKQEYNNIKIIGLRYFNVYGNGEEHKKNMSSMIYKLSHGHNKLFKHGEQSRDFVYIKDVVSANINSFLYGKSGIYNVGSGIARSFNDIANILNIQNIEYIDNPHNFYQNYTCADISYTTEQLNYEPKYNLEDGIKNMLNSDIICCIPARYNSTRLPGKPLLKINDKTIIQCVYERAKKLNVSQVIIITDDQRIYDEVKSFGGDCCILNEETLNGTDKIILYLKKYNIKANIIVNVQGDEPYFNYDDVNKAIENYKINKTLNKNVVCSTLHYGTRDIHEIQSKSRGKLVLNKKNHILYCSRNVIPSGKKENIIKDHEYNIHIGIFVYDKKYLLDYFCKENTQLQLCEDIEWMKIMEHGFIIISEKVKEAEISVDTIDDYNYLLDKYSL